MLSQKAAAKQGEGGGLRPHAGRVTRPAVGTHRQAVSSEGLPHRREEPRHHPGPDVKQYDDCEVYLETQPGAISEESTARREAFFLSLASRTATFLLRFGEKESAAYKR